MKRVAVLASGQGSNLQALIDAEARGELGATLALVVADRWSAVALARAERVGIPTAVLRLRDFATRELWDAALWKKHFDATDEEREQIGARLAELGL